MSTFVLKLIACVTMFIDHFTYVFISMVKPPFVTIPKMGMFSLPYLIGRAIGRIAFPIYCFLLVEGFFHTSNRRKYIARMTVFALISEFPFDLAFQITGRSMTGTQLIGRLFEYQNVMVTLLLGLVLMYLYEWLKMKYLMQPLIFNTLGVIAIVGIAWFAEFLKTDYGMAGIAFIMVFYLFRGKKLFLVAGITLSMFLFTNVLELVGLLAFVPIFLYNGKRGPKVKYAFYAFYPVHLLLLGGIAYFMR